MLALVGQMRTSTTVARNSCQFFRILEGHSVIKILAGLGPPVEPAMSVLESGSDASIVWVSLMASL